MISRKHADNYNNIVHITDETFLNLHSASH